MDYGVPQTEASWDLPPPQKHIIYVRWTDIWGLQFVAVSGPILDQIRRKKLGDVIIAKRGLSNGWIGGLQNQISSVFDKFMVNSYSQ